METGYDYLLVRTQWQQKIVQYVAFFLLILGAILLAIGLAYFVHAYVARSNLDDLNSSLVMTNNNFLSSQSEYHPTSGIGNTVPSDSTGGELSEAREQVEYPYGQTSSIDVSETIALFGHSEEEALSLSADTISQQHLYPGEAVNSVFWANLLEYEPTSYIETALIEGFTSITSAEAPDRGNLLPPTNIVVPAIGVTSEVQALQIVNLGDSLSYETPNQTVGHIPESSNPGEAGSSWFFGHLESPIAGEGNIFYTLPKIPDLLRQGENVYVIVDSQTTSYLYRITESLVVHQDQLRMDYQYIKELKPDYANLDPHGANIHLVACVPKLVYDHRLVVSGELVGFRKLP